MKSKKTRHPKIQNSNEKLSFWQIIVLVFTFIGFIFGFAGMLCLQKKILAVDAISLNVTGLVYCVFGISWFGLCLSLALLYLKELPKKYCIYLLGVCLAVNVIAFFNYNYTTYEGIYFKTLFINNYLPWDEVNEVVFDIRSAGGKLIVYKLVYQINFKNGKHIDINKHRCGDLKEIDKILVKRSIKFDTSELSCHSDFDFIDSREERDIVEDHVRNCGIKHGR